MLHVERVSRLYVSKAEIALLGGKVRGLVSLREQLPCFIVRNGRRDHHPIAGLPVHWRGHRLGGRFLQGLHNAQHFIHVPPRRGGIQEAELNLIQRRCMMRHTQGKVDLWMLTFLSGPTMCRARDGRWAPEESFSSGSTMLSSLSSSLFGSATIG